MNVKQANEIIEQDKAVREAKRQAESAIKRHYRVYWVNPITSLLHQLPFRDIYETDGHETAGYKDGEIVEGHLFFDCNCPLGEAENAVKTANAGKMGVCIKSRWTTYLVERLK